MKNFILFSKLFQEFIRQKSLNMTQSGGNTAENFMDNIGISLNKAKVFCISNTIKKLLLLTKVPKKNDMIKLPYPYMFIDVNFKKEELKHLGIRIDYDEIIGIMVSEGHLYSKKDELQVGNDLRISIVSRVSPEFRKERGIDDSYDTWFDTFNENVNITDKKYIDYNCKVKRFKGTDVFSRLTAYHFFLAFINFINNPEVKIVEVEANKERNFKRLKKGKIALPSLNYVQINGIMKKYITDLEESGCFHYGYRFWVRGHFRTLRDEARYGNNAGKRMWILPYIKGKGVLINKEYLVTKK